MSATPPPSAAPLSKGKRRLFTGVMLLLPVLFFVLLEGGLRLGGYGADYPLFEPVPERPDLMVQNRDVAHRYFSRQANVPNANPDYFRRRKPEGLVRIVAQGGSSAAGYPFYRGAAFPQVLGTRLRLAYPDREIEVINTAMAAVNSYTLLDFVDEIIEQEPDAVLVYAGHNEYYGALGAASTESLGRNPGVVRLYLALRHFRTVQLLRQTIAALVGLGAKREAGERPSDTLMARMVGEQTVPYGSDVFEAGLTQFRSNLSRLLAAYADAGIPVYIGTLASNERDQRPFVTVHAEGVDADAWQATMERGIEQLEQGEVAAALATLEDATAMDTLAADGFFILGHAYLAAERVDDARAAFRRARDLDGLRFRAPEAMNRIIREEAAAHGAVVVDSEALLRQRSPEGLIGHRMMLEHLHPNLDGYATLADAFFDAVTSGPVFGASSPQPTPPGRTVRLVTPMDSLAAMIRVQQLTTSWPFRPDEAQPVRYDSVRTPPFVVAQARAILGGTNWLLAADSLAQYYEATGRMGPALNTRRAIIQQFPFAAAAYVDLANLELRLAQQRGGNERIPYIAGLYEQGLAMDPNSVQANAMLGALILQNGKTRLDNSDPRGEADIRAAIPYLERALQRAPGTPQVMYNLAGAYTLTNRRDDARSLAQQLVRAQPDNPQYRRLFAELTTGG